MKYTAALLILLLLALSLSGRVDAQSTETPTPTASLSPTPSATGLAAPQLFITPQIVPTNTLGPVPKVDGCGSPFIPCGALPWPIIRWPTPNIPSPTAVPTIPTTTPVPASMTPTFTDTPSITPTNHTPSATWTPSATPTGTIQAGMDGIATLAGELGNQAATLQAQLTQQFELNGTPVGLELVAGELGHYVGAAVGIIQSFQNMNSLTFGAISLLLLSLVFTLIINIMSFVAPVLISFLKFLMNTWRTIKPF